MNGYADFAASVWMPRCRPPGDLDAGLDPDLSTRHRGDRGVL